MSFEEASKISRLFSIFHDGVIVKCSVQADTLCMEIGIQYLTEMIDPRFRKFFVCLESVHDLRFYTWPSNIRSDAEILTDIQTIFEPELEILECHVKGDQIQIICNQPSSEFEYCGGELLFTASTAKVHDESGNNHSVADLEKLCRRYWGEWERKNKSEA